MSASGVWIVDNTRVLEAENRGSAKNWIDLTCKYHHDIDINMYILLLLSCISYLRYFHSQSYGI